MKRIALWLISLCTCLSLLSPTAHAQGAGDYTVGAELNAGVATLWLKSTGAAFGWADAHYIVNQGGQQNVRMTYNSSAGRHEVKFPAQSGDSIRHFFTYNKNGLAYDSAWGTTSLTPGGGGGSVAAPVFSPGGGTFSSAPSVSMSSATAGATIRYTTDGSTPSANSAQYNGAVTVFSSSTLKAIALKSGMNNSAVTSADYVISGSANKAAAPSFSHASGMYATRISVNLLTPTVGAAVYYTVDGSTPTVNSAPYIGPVHLQSSATVKAVAIKQGLAVSDVSTANYTLSSNSAGPAWNGRTTFNIVNATKGKYPDSQVYWAIIGKDWATGKFVHVDSAGNLVPMSLSDNGALTKNGKAYTNYFTSLAQTRSVTIPALNSARIMMSVGSPMYIQVNSDINGRIGYAGANIENPDDPNVDVTFDFGEFAILPVGEPNQGIFINTTRVDQFGFPLQLNVTGLNGFNQTVGESLTETRAEIFSKFIAENPPEFAGLAKAPYAPHRIMAPAHATFLPGQPNGNYLDSYITQVWNKYTNEDLVMDLKNGWPKFTGRVVNGKFRFTDGTGTYYINGKPNTAMVMLGSGFLDDATGASDVGKQLQLQAQFCAALNRHVAELPFSDWWKRSAFYPAGQRANHFARFWHDHSVNALAYGYAYDDVGGYSPSIHTHAPVSVTYTIGW